MDYFDDKYWVFVDVDETLINIKSMFNFLKFYLLKKYKILGYIKYYLLTYKLKIMFFFNIKREIINQAFYKIFSSHNESLVNTCGQEWFNRNLRDPNFFNNTVVNEVLKHKANGAGIVLVSGSFKACVLPIAKYLEIEHCLITNLEVKNNKYTGSIIPPQLIGYGKAESVKKFLVEQSFDKYQLCYAYADHISDIDILKLVGNSIVIPGDPALMAYAKENGWKILK